MSRSLGPLFVGALLMVSCRPTAGGTCTLGQAACLDDGSGLFCSASGAYARLSCRGPNGCRQEGAKVSCDQSTASPGDSCARSGFACTPDKQNDLACRQGVFVLAEPCAGPFGCRVAPFDGVAAGGAGNVMCDADIARAGDPCLEEGDYACTADGSIALQCVSKRMSPVGACNGPKGCSVVHLRPKGTASDCDTKLDDGGS
jgi:hypothetical protein